MKYLSSRLAEALLEKEAKALQEKIEEQGQADNRGFISWLKQLSGSG